MRVGPQAPKMPLRASRAPLVLEEEVATSIPGVDARRKRTHSSVLMHRGLLTIAWALLVTAVLRARSVARSFGVLMGSFIVSLQTLNARERSTGESIR